MNRLLVFQSFRLSLIRDKWLSTVSTGKQQKQLRSLGFDHPSCTNYLSPAEMSQAELRNDWMQRKLDEPSGRDDVEVGVYAHVW